MVSEQDFRALEARVDMLEGQLRQYACGPTAEMVAKKYGWLLDKTQVANEIGVTRVTVYRMVEDGRLQMTSDGKITAASVARYLNGEAPYRKNDKRTKGA